MTIEEAIRILDPETSKEALQPYAYDSHQRRKVVDEACNIAVSELRMRQWISVEDRLPDSDGSYLCYYGYDKTGHCHSYKMHMGCLDYFADDNEPHWQHSGVGLFVTHWMPLPEPPKEC